MISSLINSLFNVVISLLYNRFLIVTYGSEINGLIGTLSQFVSFFSVLEGGFTTAAVVSLYKPMAEKDYKKVSDILYTAKKYLEKIGMVILLFSLCLGTLYINFIKSPLLFKKTFFLLFLTCINTFLNISLVSKYTILLESDNKTFLTHTFAFVPKVIFKVLAIFLMAKTNADIVLVYLTTLFEILLNIIIALVYERIHYPSISFSGEYSPSGIKGTKDIFAQKIASIIFSSTDLLLISIMIGLSSSSVYNLYMQVFKTVTTMLISILVSPFNSFGLLFQTEEERKTERLFSIYRKLSSLTSTIIIVSLASFLIPFIKIYTKDISDIQYLDLYLVLLCYSCFFFQTTNTPYGLLINSAGFFKLQNAQSILAAIVNILLSFILAKSAGIYGIVFGSLVGYLIILFSNIIKLYSKVFKAETVKPALKDVVLIGINYLFGILYIYLNYRIGFNPKNYMILLVYGVIITAIFGAICILYNFIVDREDTKKSISYIINAVLKRINNKGIM